MFICKLAHTVHIDTRAVVLSCSPSLPIHAKENIHELKVIRLRLQHVFLSFVTHVYIGSEVSRECQRSHSLYTLTTGQAGQVF